VLDEQKYTLAYRLQDVILAAGKIARDSFNSRIQVQSKSDGTPVTSVDYAIHEYLQTFCINRDIGYLSEEGVGELDQNLILYADPLDGTQSFIDGNPDFTVVISLMERIADDRFRTLAAYIYQPMTDFLWKQVASDKTIVSEGADNGRYTEMHGPCGGTANIAVVMPKKTASGPARAGILEQIEFEPDLKFTYYGSTGYIGGLLTGGTVHAAIFGQEDAHEMAAVVPLVIGSRQGPAQSEGFVCDFDGKPVMEFTLERTGDQARFVVPNGIICASTPHLATRLLAMVKEEILV